jgi:LmbE family N-acetylglucosaminyl deacetylase
MKFIQENVQIYVPDGLTPEEALRRTTRLAVGAHQDDLEIMAAAGIVECYHRPHEWFSGVVVTDGSGSPRDGLYAGFSDKQMMHVRAEEQKKAAALGEYAAQVLLGYPSSIVKDGNHPGVMEDLLQILQIARPDVVYTHNLADKHETHVAVGLRTIAAIRKLPVESRPSCLLGCEVWRDLDWMLDDEKVVLDMSMHENLQQALVGVFDSQISGGKRIDLATMARRMVNATFLQSHETNTSQGLAFAMDLTPLVSNPDLDIAEYVEGFLHRLTNQIKISIQTLK